MLRRVAALTIGFLISLAIGGMILRAAHGATPGLLVDSGHISAESDHQPPRFLPAVVLYDGNGRFIAIEVGKTFSYTCKDALGDAQSSIEKATAVGRRLVGLCIPVP